MKIGRNDPCPCGSGEKYKKCCMGKEVISLQELTYRRLSEVYNRLERLLLSFAEHKFGKLVAMVAMQEFLLWPESDEEIDEDLLDRIGPLFFPWFLFNWEYDPLDSEEVLSVPENRTMAELYVEDRAARLDHVEKKLIDGINREPYSFWEVISAEKGKGMTLSDAFRGIRIVVQERKGSEYVNTGDLLFGRVVSVDGVGMLIGVGGTLIPPGQKTKIIALRKRMGHNQPDLDSDDLYQWDSEIRELYLSIDQSLYSRPKIQNTDGDPLEMHELIYEVSSAAEAFEKLFDLCVSMNRRELEDEAERDGAGRIIRVEIPWDRKGQKLNTKMSNTILGRIVIDGKRLTAEVNSARRAKDLRRKIDTRLGEAGRFQMDVIQDLESAMSKGTTNPDGIKRSKEHEELMKIPEVREQLMEIFSNHWENWVDHKIPALGDKTPRKAVKTPDGREAVEALLKEAEQDRGQDPLMLEVNRKGAQRVREKLGLIKQ